MQKTYKLSYITLYVIELIIRVDMYQWRSQGRAWPGTCPAKVRCVYVRASASVVSAMVRRTAGARPIPMTWLRH